MGAKAWSEHRWVVARLFISVMDSSDAHYRGTYTILKGVTNLFVFGVTGTQLKKLTVDLLACLTQDVGAVLPLLLGPQMRAELHSIDISSHHVSPSVPACPASSHFFVRNSTHLLLGDLECTFVLAHLEQFADALLVGCESSHFAHEFPDELGAFPERLHVPIHVVRHASVSHHHHHHHVWAANPRLACSLLPARTPFLLATRSFLSRLVTWCPRSSPTATAMASCWLGSATCVRHVRHVFHRRWT